MRGGRGEELTRTKHVRSYGNLLITLCLGFRTQGNQVGNELEIPFLLGSIISLEVAGKAVGRENSSKVLTRHKSCSLQYHLTRQLVPYWSNSGMIVMARSNHCLTRFEACSTGENSCLVLWNWSKLLTGDIISHRRDLSVVLISRHGTNLLSSYYFYIHRRVLVVALIKAAFLCSGLRWRQWCVMTECSALNRASGLPYPF